MKRKTINVKLLRKIQRIIVKEPRKFDMDWWHKDGTLWLWDCESPKCGTAHCIGGWAHSLSKKVGEPDEIAASELGLTGWQATILFALPSWPDQFRRDYEARKTPSARAKVAARRIDHFIKTGGKE